MYRFLGPKQLHGSELQFEDFQEFWREEFGTRTTPIEQLGEIGSWGFVIDVAQIAAFLAFHNAPAVSEAIKYALARLKDWIGQSHPHQLTAKPIRPKLPPGIRDVHRSAKEISLEVTNRGYKLYIKNP